MIRETSLIMGMPIVVQIIDGGTPADCAAVFCYFDEIDERFSPFKETSEVTALNRGRIKVDEASLALQTILALAEETRRLSGGYFDIQRGDGIDPSGIVKGWAIQQAAGLLEERGFRHFFIEAGGDIQVRGLNHDGQPWRVGIRHPFLPREIMALVHLSDQGIATSGSYERGDHIYNPLDLNQPLTEVVSLTVIGPSIYEADRLATAAFAMGARGIDFLEQFPGVEGLMVDRYQMGTETSGFHRYRREL